MPINDDGCWNGFYFWLNSEFWIRTSSFFSEFCRNREKNHGLPELIHRSGLCVASIVYSAWNKSYLFVYSIPDISIRVLLNNSRSQNVMIVAIYGCDLYSNEWNETKNEIDNNNLSSFVTTYSKNGDWDRVAVQIERTFIWTAHQTRAWDRLVDARTSKQTHQSSAYIHVYRPTLISKLNAPNRYYISIVAGICVHQQHRTTESVRCSSFAIFLCAFKSVGSVGDVSLLLENETKNRYSIFCVRAVKLSSLNMSASANGWLCFLQLASTILDWGLMTATMKWNHRQSFCYHCCRCRWNKSWLACWTHRMLAHFKSAFESTL